MNRLCDLNHKFTMTKSSRPKFFPENLYKKKFDKIHGRNYLRLHHLKILLKSLFVVIEYLGMLFHKKQFLHHCDVVELVLKFEKQLIGQFKKFQCGFDQRKKISSGNLRDAFVQGPPSVQEGCRRFLKCFSEHIYYSKKLRKLIEFCKKIYKKCKNYISMQKSSI